jgi:nuclear pore complex protein Nup205
MLALALHVSDISSSVYREAVLAILNDTFGHCAENMKNASMFQSPDTPINTSNGPMNRNKVMLNVCYYCLLACFL